MTVARSNLFTTTENRLRVIELAQGVAGPACGRLFAAVGHDVVKCEPSDGDYLRRQMPLGDSGVGRAFAALNNAKRSTILDMHNTEQLSEARELLRAADVAIIDFLPDAEDVLHLSRDTFCRYYPELIVISITCFGTGGEFSDIAGDSLLAESYGGMANMIGEPHERPLTLGNEQAAFAAAFAGMFGGALALRARTHTGHGDFVDVAMCDVAAFMDWKSDVICAAQGVAPHRLGAAGDRWRMVQAKDGWLGVIYQPSQWTALVDLIGDMRLSAVECREATTGDATDSAWEIIEAWAKKQPVRFIYDEAQKRGLPFGYCARAADLARDPQYRATGFVSDSGNAKSEVVETTIGLPLHIEDIRWCWGGTPAPGEHQRVIRAEWQTQQDARRRARTQGPGRSQTRSAPPLAGITVLDFGTITAGAATSRLLADYGADVIKVESQDHPDPFRNWTLRTSSDKAKNLDPVWKSSMFESNNLGKRSVALDLKSPEGREALYELVRGADIVVENFRLGVTSRLGIDFGTIRAINPRIIYVSLTSQGSSGPEANNSSYGSTLDLLSGLASVTGYDSGHPTWSSYQVNYPDQLVSLFAAAMIVCCMQAERTGVHLDIPQREVVSWTLADLILDYVERGITAEATGNHRPGRIPHEIYSCRSSDAWVAITCFTEVERLSLARLVAPEWAERSYAWWVANEAAIDSRLQEWCRERARQEVVDLMHSVGVPCVPVLTAAERAATSRFNDRRVRLMKDRIPLKGFPIVMQRYAPPIPKDAPPLGADNGASWTREAGRYIREGAEGGI